MEDVTVDIVQSQAWGGTSQIAYRDSNSMPEQYVLGAWHAIAQSGEAGMISLRAGRWPETLAPLGHADTLKHITSKSAPSESREVKRTV